MRTTSHESQHLSTADVAEALSISVTTVKRWVDEGILPAAKTAGGHRKVLLADVMRLARDGELANVDVAKLFPKSRKLDLSSPALVLDQMRTGIDDSNADAIRGLLVGAYRHGYSAAALADQVIGPLLSEIGRDWELGKIGVMHEHRATQMIVAALYALRAEIGLRSNRHRAVAVGGAPEEDSTIVPSLLAQLVLLDAGWDAINLGPNTPASAFAAAMDELKPKLLWLCVTHLSQPDLFVRAYLQVHQHATERDIAVAVGGRSLTRAIRERMPYTFFGDGMAHLANFANTLSPRPSVPKKGRPVSSPR